MRKIKILFTIPNFVSAGSGREMVNIIERLDPNLFEITICIKRSGGDLEQELRSKQHRLLVSDFYSEAGNPIKKLLEIIRFSNYFRQFRFDLWHSFHWSSDYSEALIAKLAGAHYLYTKKNMNWNRKAWKIKSWFASHIIARNTTMLKTCFATKHYQNKVTFIPGGVDVTKFSIHTQPAEYRKQLGIDKHDYLITCVAQLIPIKGQHLLVEAVREITSVKVALAGAERNLEYSARIRSLIEGYNLSDRVFVLGSVQNVAGLLKESDLFVLPTTKDEEHEEGCPVALLEAMAVGVPCIASDVAGSTDLIRHETNGLLFKSGITSELKTAIQRMKENKAWANELGIEARADVLKSYTMDRESKRFQEVYEGMIAL